MHRISFLNISHTALKCRAIPLFPSFSPAMDRRRQQPFSMACTLRINHSTLLILFQWLVEHFSKALSMRLVWTIELGVLISQKGKRKPKPQSGILLGGTAHRPADHRLPRHYWRRGAPASGTGSRRVANLQRIQRWRPPTGQLAYGSSSRSVRWSETTTGRQTLAGWLHTFMFSDRQANTKKKDILHGPRIRTGRLPISRRDNSIDHAVWPRARDNKIHESWDFIEKFWGK
jgi:hypothetical protein